MKPSDWDSDWDWDWRKGVSWEGLGGLKRTATTTTTKKPQHKTKKRNKASCLLPLAGKKGKRKKGKKETETPFLPQLTSPPFLPPISLPLSPLGPLGTPAFCSNPTDWLVFMMPIGMEGWDGMPIFFTPQLLCSPTLGYSIRSMHSMHFP